MPEFMTDYLSGLANGLMTTLNTPDAYLNKVALTAIIVVIGMGLHTLFEKMITRKVKSYTRRFKLHKGFKQSIVTLTAILVLLTWVQAINVLILIALLIGVFIVFMVRGLTTNIIAYFVIKYRQYIEVGHRVEINGIVGDVVDINPVHIKLLEVHNWLSSDTNTGRVIKLPNSIIFNDSIKMTGVINQFVWHEIKYVLTFESNWQKAENILTDVGSSYFNEFVEPELKENNDDLPHELGALQPAFSLDTNTDGIIVILRYMVDYRNGSSVKTALQRKILSQFNAQQDINFAMVDVRIISE